MKFNFTLPLLAKELTERAAQKRTYILRVIYAVLSFGVFGMSVRTALEWMLQFGGLGMGIFFLKSLTFLQIVGIYLFLPAMMCGSIASEKERDSLSLLLLTRLSPTQILLQKYLAGLIPMGTFLLLSLPLGAWAYTVGGISVEYLMLSACVLVLTCLQVGAIALLCSTWCRSTVSAFIATYAFGAVFYLFLPLLSGLPRALGLTKRTWIPEGWMELLFPPAAVDRLTVTGTGVLDWMPLILSIVVFLLVARFLLVRRAFVPAGNPLLSTFRKLDRWMHGLNQWFGNITFLKRERALPDREPIVWMETMQKALGHPHYLVRMGVLLELFAVGAGILMDFGAMEGIYLFLFGFAALMLTVQGANIFVSERVHQTLDVILTTPLSAREILRQKMQVQRRLLWVLFVPLGTFIAIGGVFGFERRLKDAGYFAIGTTLSLLLCLPIMSWVAVWIGMKMRTRFKAIVTSVAVIAGWCLIPFIGLEMWGTGGFVTGYGVFLSPLSVQMLAVEGRLFGYSSSSKRLFWLIYLVVHAAILFWIRRYCLRNADRFLRR